MSEQSPASPRHTCTTACQWFTCARQRVLVTRRRAVEDEVRHARGWWLSFKAARRAGFARQADAAEREARASIQHARWLHAFHSARLAALDGAA